MSLKRHQERGNTVPEAILVIIIVAILAFVGWYVYHASKNSNKVLNAATSSKSSTTKNHTTKTTDIGGSTADGTDNTSLQNELNSAKDSSTESGQSLTDADSSFKDKSTFTSVPQ